MKQGVSGNKVKWKPGHEQSCTPCQPAWIYLLRAGLANYITWTKSSLPFVFVNQVLLE